MHWYTNHTLDICCCCIISVSSTGQWSQKGVWLFWVQLKTPELSSLKCVDVKQELNQQQARQHCQQRRVEKREYVENMMVVFASSSNQCHCPMIAVITSPSNQCQDCRGPLKNGRGLSWASSLKVKEWLRREGHRENVSDQLLENLIELQLLIVHHLQQLRQGGWIILGYLADATYSQMQTISLAYNKQPQYYRRWWSKLVKVGRVSTTSTFGTVDYCQ